MNPAALSLAITLLAGWPGEDRPMPVLPVHPDIVLLDHQGQNVLQSGRPVSTMTTCGQCHDTRYISEHSYHVGLDRDGRTVPGVRPGWGDDGRQTPGAAEMNCFLCHTSKPDNRARLEEIQRGRFEWSATATLAGTGLVRAGKPIAVGDLRTDITRSVMSTLPDPTAMGTPVLRQLPLTPDPSPARGEGSVGLDRSGARGEGTVQLGGSVARGDRSFPTGQPTAHYPLPTAHNPLPTPSGDWAYQSAAFRPDGAVSAARLGLRAPTSENCGQCHGMVWQRSEPLSLSLSLSAWSTAAKGQVFSPQRMSESAVNLRGKRKLTRAWDVHAERLLECTGCHFPLNSPVSFRPSADNRLTHLAYDPRRLSIGDFLVRPSHDFAKGRTAQGTVARHLEGTMRRCNDCHAVSATHDWLPYREAHFRRLSCEACHVSTAAAPAVRQADWTILSPSLEPRIEWRGIEGSPEDPRAEITGFRPVLLPRPDEDGQERLVPMNLVTSWYWVEGDHASRPVPLEVLRKALFQGNVYRPEIMAALDSNRDGRIDAAERALDRPEKVEAVRRQLLAAGVQAPRIETQIQPYELHHGVAAGRWATRQCGTCHAADSRLAEDFELASYVPGGELPPGGALRRSSGNGSVRFAGQEMVSSQGQLVFQPETRRSGLYVLGHDGWTWVNTVGGLALVGVVLTVAVHAGLRIRSRQP